MTNAVKRWGQTEAAVSELRSNLNLYHSSNKSAREDGAYFRCSEECTRFIGRTGHQGIPEMKREQNSRLKLNQEGQSKIS